MNEVTATVPSLWPLGLGLGAFGMLIVLARGRIAVLYDRTDMPEEDRKRFKRLVVPLVGWMFIALGALVLLGAAADSFRPGILRAALQSAGPRDTLAWVFVLLGVGNALSHITGWPRLMKLGTMMNTYGKVRARVLHLVVYSAVPIGFGVWILLKKH